MYGMHGCTTYKMSRVIHLVVGNLLPLAKHESVSVNWLVRVFTMGSKGGDSYRQKPHCSVCEIKHQVPDN